MNISIGNIIIITVIAIAGGIMIRQYFLTNRTDSFDDGDWLDDYDQTEETIEETEEFLRRMERLSKKEEDDRKK